MARFRMQERDLDLLILEELHSDSGFDRWFGEHIGLTDFSCAAAEHSVSAKSNAKWGETDVLAFYANGSETVAVLIEDKIAAEFQDRQAERYKERAADLVADGKAERTMVILVAPSLYLSSVKDDPWDKQVKLEALHEWFAARNGAHNNWRAASLSECLGRVRRTKLAGSEHVRAFSAAFAAYLMERHAQRFSHSITSDKWGFIVEFPHRPVHVQLAWKTGRSSVDLTFSGHHVAKAVDFDQPQGVGKRIMQNAAELPTGVIFGVDVPLVDLTMPLADQADVIEAVVTAFEMLLPIVPRIVAQKLR